MQSLILRSHPLLCSFIVMNVVQFIVINVLCETGNSYQKHLDPKSGLFNTLVVAAMGDPEQQRHHHSSHQHHHDDEDNEDNEHTLTKAGPYFDATMAKNVTGMLGKTTYLNCHVHNLANKTKDASTTVTEQVTQTATWTGTGTQKVLCYVVTDALTGADMATYTVTGALNTNTITFNAKSAAGKKIALSVVIIGSL